MSDDASNTVNNGSAPDSTTSSDSSSTPNENAPYEPERNIREDLKNHFMANKIDVTLWATRILAILFTICYVLPIFCTQQSAFVRVLLANAAISALRLHQRLPTLTFSREFLTRLIVEDSCHYLLYSLIFFNIQPTLLVLIPIALFATLHAASYSLKLLDILGQNSWWGARFIISIVEFQAVNILRAAAFAEIFLMPCVVLLTLMSRAGLMTPIVYYHFLFMRYSSRRNPYTRTAFTQLRIVMESYATRAPPVIGNIIRKCIAQIARLAPELPPASQ